MHFYPVSEQKIYTCKDLTMITHDQTYTSGPINLDTPIRFSTALPASVDICIIGGGIIGVSTALYLAEQGQSVLLCEKGRIACEQSSRNWGWVRQQGRDAAELPLMMESNQIWQNLAKRCQSNLLKFSQHGVYYLAESQEKLAKYDKFLSIAKNHGLDTRLMSKSEVDILFPGNQANWIGGMVTPSDGRAEPWVAVPALAKAAEHSGALIKENCAVRYLEQTNGRVSSVITEAGSVKVQQVVLSGGAWSSLFARNLGIDIPQLSVKSSVARFDNIPEGFNANASDSKIAFCRRLDGGYNVALCDRHDYYIGPDSLRQLWRYRQALRASWHSIKLHPRSPTGYPDAWETARRFEPDELSPFEKMRVLDALAAADSVDTMRIRLVKRFPSLKGINISHSWGGIIDTMPDFVPIIDESESLKGLWIATGFSGHGFGIGPAIGRILSDLLQGRPVQHDLSRFRFNRFTDESKIHLGPAL